ncbi:Response regulator UvrY [Marinomonas spartinae]|uniref:Response regulator UvrY n=1 Tax=Marinomonas spartinae TaxID=1792290 RepID=A0A1A8TSL5_9GAMM|nr:response regulator transcription factor [Marinomonas spartinae]SBS37741.1 Response regulator UvrY [Marinomonas spartinae]
MINAVVVDDHVMFQQGVKALLEESQQISVVDTATNVIDAERIIMGKKPDVCVLDISLTQGNGLELAERLRSRGYQGAIVMLTMHTELSIFKRASSIAKIDGYVLKLDASEDLVKAIMGAMSGKRFVSPAIAQEMAWQDGQNNLDESPLSTREIEVLTLVAEGHGSEAIASRLKLSKRTVDNHRANIRKKLGLTNSAELTRYAIEQGLLLNLNVR